MSTSGYFPPFLGIIMDTSIRPVPNFFRVSCTKPNDVTSDTKETIEKDAHGNVVKHEKTGPDGKAVEVK